MEAGNEVAGHRGSCTSKMSLASKSSPVNHSDGRVLCPHTDVPGCFHTCAHPYHSRYWEGNLPPLIFRLDASITVNQQTLQVLLEDGEVVVDADGIPLRDFPFLPRYISVKISGWLLEYWMRTDTRLTYRDVKARMTAPSSELPLDNTLNMRREREARTPLNLSCLTTRRGQIARKEVERIEAWTPDQISYNTTMVVEYNRVGEKQVPFRLRSKTLTDAPPTYYPLDTFLEGDQLHIPGPRIKQTIDLFYQLSDLAAEMNLPSWEHLPLEYLPNSWKPRSFPSRTKSGPRRKYMTRRMVVEENNAEPENSTETDGNAITPGSVKGRKSNDHNFNESHPHYDTTYEEELLKFSGLPNVIWYKDSRVRSAPVANHISKAELTSHAPHSHISPFLIPWNPVNSQQNDKIPVKDWKRSSTILLDTEKAEHAISQLRRARRDKNSYRTFSPFQSSERGELCQDDLITKPGTEIPPSWAAEPIWFNRYRFNSSGARSIKNDKTHPLNTRTLEIMRRNNPFLPENLENDSLPSSLEKYLNSSIRRFEGNAYPSP